MNITWSKGATKQNTFLQLFPVNPQRRFGAQKSPSSSKPARVQTAPVRGDGSNADESLSSSLVPLSSLFKSFSAFRLVLDGMTPNAFMVSSDAFFDSRRDLSMISLNRCFFSSVPKISEKKEALPRYYSRIHIVIVEYFP